MKNGILFFLLILSCTYINASLAAKFIACKSTYALCTTAPCSAIPGKKNWLSCRCKVKTGYSAGQNPCQPIKKTDHGEIIKSRYYPIKGYVRCSNDRPWAWCLDMPCLIDKRSQAKANCICSVVKNQGDYIIVTDKYSKTACTTGLYSSATVKAANQVTEFLKSQPKLQPFPIKVYK